MQSAHLLRHDPAEILARPKGIAALTPDVLRSTFRQYFPLERYTVVTAVPAKGSVL
jgi:predicted Zn-dependent peptidase